MAADMILSPASTRQDVVQSKTLTNGSSFEMGSLSAGVPTAPGFSHPHHHIIRREPVFVPALYNVRRAALAHAEQDLRSTYQKVQQVDYRMRQARTWPDQRVQDSSTGKIEDLQRERTELLDRLVDLVPRFDEQLAGELKMQQLHNHAYLTNHGLAATHFMLGQTPVHDDIKNSETWLMLESLEAAHKDTLTRDHTSAKLDEFAAERMRSVCGGRYLQNVYRRRPMTLLERQRGAVAFINGIARPIRSRLLLWRFLFVTIAIVLVVFFGVGMIASTQEFAPVFLKNYFAIAVAWSLSSSALLGWYIKLLGGTRTEAAAGFLAILGLWLVIIQIGQIRRSVQTSA